MNLIMSTYIRQKVLRLPLSKYINYLDTSHEGVFDENFQDLFRYHEPHFFELSPTTTTFLDYVLESERDAEGEYGKTRSLRESEKTKYAPILNKSFLMLI